MSDADERDMVVRNGAAMLKELQAQVERLEGERDGWKKAADASLMKHERDTLKDKLEQAKGVVAALVAGDCPAIVPQAAHMVMCIYCHAKADRFSPMHHTEDCAVAVGLAFLWTKKRP